MTNCIKKTLEIKDVNIFLEDKIEMIIKNKIKSYCYFGSLTYVPTTCQNSNCTAKYPDIVKNGTRTSTIHLVSISGRPAYLKLKKQRFYCRSCSKSFTASTDFVAKNDCLSTLLKRWIINELSEITSLKKIAKTANVSTTTVSRLLTKAAQHVKIRPTNFLPAHMCFDEFKSVRSAKGAMSFIYCDSQTHQIVDIVENRQLGELKEHFRRYDLKVRQDVKSITIDMYVPYIELIKDLFPNAKIIIDKFHIVQALNRELNRHRIKVMNGYKHSNHRLYNKLKKYWKLFLENPDKLTHTIYRKFPLFDYLTHTGGIVDYLLKSDNALKEAYYLTHRLRDALTRHNFVQVEEILTSSALNTLPKGFQRVLRTLRNYLPYIQNTCTYPYTNGPIEGLNNKIKVLKRTAYGYRSYTNFRNRILLISRLYIPTLKNEKSIKR